MIPYGKHDVQQADIDNVVEVLKSDFLTQGPRVPDFEAAVTSITTAQHAVAVNSATSALHIACLALDLGPGDWLWTSPITFVASANCAIFCGASVDFVDIDEKTYNMSPDALEVKLQEAEAKGKLPKIVVPVHLTGQSCDMKRIQKLSEKYGFRIIEDASHAIGGSYLSNKIGSCQFSDVTVFSFHPVKIVTTAEGGMAMTNSDEIAQKMRLAASHGITRDPDLMTRKQDGAWYYQQISLGFNYRMNELQAALGLKQLERLDKYVTTRASRAVAYDSMLSGLPLLTPYQHSDAQSSWHLYVIQLTEDAQAPSRSQVFDALRSAGIGVNVHYIPVHLQPFYESRGFGEGDFPCAEKYYSRAISLPLFPLMTDSDQRYVVSTLNSILDLKAR